MTFTIFAPAIFSSFTASIVEAVEAFSIILAVGTLQGWKPAFWGAGLALVVLAISVVILGPLLRHVPTHDLQLLIGVLLLLFGMGWLKKAILRSAGIIPLHDESKVYNDALQEGKESQHNNKQAWIGGLMAFKAVLLEGLEVVFIVIAVGAGNGLLLQASIGAAAACLVVLIAGLFLHRPLTKVPENTLKFIVGVMLTSFGVFWAGEGLGITWPYHDWILFAFAAYFLMTGMIASKMCRRFRLWRF